MGIIEGVLSYTKQQPRRIWALHASEDAVEMTTLDSFQIIGQRVKGW